MLCSHSCSQFIATLYSLVRSRLVFGTPIRHRNPSKFVECISQCFIFILLCDYTPISNNVKFRQSCFCYKEGSNTKLAHFAQEMLRKVATLQRRPWMTAAKASKRVDSFSCLPHLVIVFILIEDACGGSLPHPQAPPPNNLRVLCEHLHLPKPRQVEFKARIIAMTCAVNSTC